MNYQPKYYKYIVDARTSVEALPLAISQLVNSYENCIELLNNEPVSQQEKWMLIMEQADAVICAQIFKYFQLEIENTKYEKLRQMKLKAQSLKAKWNK